MNLLEQDIMYLPGVGPRRKDLLNNELGVATYGDLLEYFPYKYVDRTKIYRISELTGDMPFVQIKGHILSFESHELSPRKKRLVAHFTDGTTICDLVWFNGVSYAAKTYLIGKEYVVFGKPGVYNGRIQFTHPDLDDASQLQLNDMGDAALLCHYRAHEEGRGDEPERGETHQDPDRKVVPTATRDAATLYHGTAAPYLPR